MLAPSCNDNEGAMMNDERVALPPDPKRRVRLRRSEKTWRGIFARQRSSGMTVEEFCRAEGIGRSTFNRWQMRLHSRDSLAGRARSAQADTVPPPESGDRFIDAGEMRVDNASATIEIRLDLGDGVLLTIRRG
jgi:transposase-like protein